MGSILAKNCNCIPEIEVGVVEAAAVADAAVAEAVEESFSLRRRAASSSELEELLLELDPLSSSEDELPEAPDPGGERISI